MIKKREVITKILAIIGTAMVCFPILTPIVFSAIALLQTRTFHIDYLMPAELFLPALVGGALLLWAALRARRRQALIGWCLGCAVAFPIIGQVLASVTGLASGEIEPTGFWWALVLASLAGYTLALAVLAFGGLLLLFDLFKPPRPKSSTNQTH
jgi:hypothetical protein